MLPFIDSIDKCIASVGIWGVGIQAVSILGASSQGNYYHYDVFYCSLWGLKKPWLYDSCGVSLFLNVYLKPHSMATASSCHLSMGKEQDKWLILGHSIVLSPLALSPCLLFHKATWFLFVWYWKGLESCILRLLESGLPEVFPRHSHTLMSPDTKNSLRETSNVNLTSLLTTTCHVSENYSS